VHHLGEDRVRIERLLLAQVLADMRRVVL